LYGQTEAYLSSITQFIYTTINEIKEEFERLSQYADGLSQGTQASAALDVVHTAIACGSITPNFILFVLEYFRRAKKAGAGLDRLQSAIDYAKTFTTRGDEATQMNYNKLLKAMEEAKNQK